MSFPVLVILTGLAAVLLLRIRALRVRVLAALDRAYGRFQAELGTMDPEQFIRYSLRAIKRAAVSMSRSNLVFPNVIDIAVAPVDYDHWGPLATRLKGMLVAAMREAAEDDEFVVVGEPTINIQRIDGVSSHRPRFKMSLQQAQETQPQPQRKSGVGARTPLIPVRGEHRGRPTAYSPSDGASTRRSIAAIPTSRMVVLMVEVNRVPRLELHCAEGRHIGGTGPHCDLRLDHETVSDVHFELTVIREQVSIRDLESTNGTRMQGGELAVSAVVLHDGDIIHLSGEVTLRVLRGAAKPKAA